MADLKISELPAKTSLAGTEELPIADSGASKKVTVGNLLAGAASAESENTIVAMEVFA